MDAVAFSVEHQPCAYRAACLIMNCQQQSTFPAPRGPAFFCSRTLDLGWEKAGKLGGGAGHFPYNTLRLVVPLNPGELLVVDNRAIAHGRRPYLSEDIELD